MNEVDQSKFWEDIYLEDDVSWDLEGVTPVFEILSKSLPKGKICIVGCGLGYDAIMFAQKGFEVTAIDFAPTAINFVKSLAIKSKVKVNTVKADIFSLKAEHLNTYDYIIEQTCFCAIHPSRRKEYEKLVKSILKPDGQLIGLWFPLDKKLDEGGPAWGTTLEEVKSIFNLGWSIVKEEFPKHSIEPRKGREKLIIFRKC